MRVEKLRGLLFLSFLCLFLTACETSNLGLDADDSPKTPSAPAGDRTPPVIMYFEPDADEENVEVDRVIRIEFDELFDADTFLDDFDLFSGKNVDEQRELMSPRPFNPPSFTEKVAVGRDPVTNAEIDIQASVVEIVPIGGRFALDTSYTFRLYIPTPEYFNKTPEERERDDDENEQTIPDDSDVAQEDPESTLDFRDGKYDETTHFFTVESGAWRRATQVGLVDASGPLTGDVQELASASNAAGELVVVSRHSVGGVVQAFISKYLPNANRWTTVGSSGPSEINATQLSTITDTNVFGTKVAVAANGRIAVTWYQALAPGQMDSVWARVFDGTQWTSPIRLGAADANRPDLAFDAAGNLFVVWRQQVDGYYRIHSAIFPALGLPPTEPVTGQQISGEEAGHAYAPSLAVGLSGVVRAFWTHAVENGNRGLFSSTYSSSRWWSVERIDNSNAGSVGNYSAVMGVRNEGMVAWDQFDGQRSNLMSRRILGAALGSTVDLREQDSTIDAQYPDMGIDPEGKIILVWRQLTLATGAQSLRESVYQKNSGWTPASELASLGESEVGNVDISFDREGNATAIWKLGQNGSSSVGVRRYLKMTGWTNPVLISASNGGMRGSPSLAQMYEDGRALAVWSQYDGSAYRLTMNRYVEQSIVTVDD